MGAAPEPERGWQGRDAAIGRDLIGLSELSRDELAIHFGNARAWRLLAQPGAEEVETAVATELTKRYGLQIGDGVDAYQSVGSGLVFYDHRLTKRARVGGDEARRYVGESTGWKT